MATEGIKTRSATDAPLVTVKDGASRAKTRFGDVTISGPRPSAAVVKFNVKRSTEALERVTRTLTKPGVALPAKKDVPLFSVAEGETDIFIRTLNGSTERGRLINGVFKVID